MLKKKNIQGKTLTMLENYLVGLRTNEVLFNGVHSEEVVFRKGVPQGSPLSPLLFNLYLSDIGSCGKKNISQFADDLVIWETGSDPIDISKKLNRKLKRVGKYLKEKELQLSSEKCVAVNFNRKHGINEAPEIKIGGTKIAFSEKAKYLGIIFDRKLTWKHLNT